MPFPNTTICDLPDELVLETIQYFSTIRSYEPQSTAFKEKEKEKARQCENRLRQRALHSLCLTSNRLRQIATPLLYASFLGSATLYGFEPLKLFHRTISSSGCAVGVQLCLAEYLQYVETRLSDYLGNSLYEDTGVYGNEHIIPRYFYLLADIVRLAPNIQHLSIVSLETEAVSFWKHILPGDLGKKSSPASTMIASHGFRKLCTLCFQMHAPGYNNNAEIASFRRICSAMASVPSLTEFRASGVMSSGPPSPLVGLFTNIQRLEITECALEFEEVGEMWSACIGLRHIMCEWAFLDCSVEVLSNLYQGLLKHAETLETLFLDMREVRYSYSWPEVPPRLGPLQPLARLESLTICDTGLFGGSIYILDYPNDLGQDPEIPVAELLPVNLKSLILLLHDGFQYNHEDLVERYGLCRLSQDCKTDLTELRKVTLKCNFGLDAPSLKEDFNEAGVRFDIIDEPKVPASG